MGPTLDYIQIGQTRESQHLSTLALWAALPTIPKKLGSFSPSRLERDSITKVGSSPFTLRTLILLNHFSESPTSSYTFQHNTTANPLSKKIVLANNFHFFSQNYWISSKHESCDMLFAPRKRSSLDFKTLKFWIIPIFQNSQTCHITSR